MELKPCPFCGQYEAPEVMQESDSFSVYHGSYQVICNTRNCGCGSSSGYYRTIERAVTAWNVRGIYPTIKAGVKWHESHCPKSNPCVEKETEPCDAEYKPYKVVLEDEGCPNCGATPAWTIECPGGIFAGQAWCGPEGKERAEEWAETLNCAYEQGKKAGNRARQLHKEEAMKESNRKQCADFTIMVGGEEWHCDAVYLQVDHTPAWYECSTHRDGIAFRRIFGPKWLAGEGVVLPEIDYATS